MPSGRGRDRYALALKCPCMPSCSTSKRLWNRCLDVLQLVSGDWCTCTLNTKTAAAGTAAAEPTRTAAASTQPKPPWFSQMAVQAAAAAVMLVCAVILAFFCAMACRKVRLYHMGHEILTSRVRLLLVWAQHMLPECCCHPSAFSCVAVDGTKHRLLLNCFTFVLSCGAFAAKGTTTS